MRSRLLILALIFAGAWVAVRFGILRPAAAPTRRALGVALPSEAKRPRIPTIDEIESLYERGCFSDAEHDATALLPQIEHERGPDSLEVARVLRLIALARARTRQPDLFAMGCAERAARITERRRGSAPLEHARSLRVLADTLIWGADNTRAEALLRDALRIEESLLGGNHPEVGSTLVELARCLQFGGYVDRALEVAARARRVLDARGIHEPGALARALFLEGQLLGEKGEYAAAGNDLRRSLRLQLGSLGADHPQTADTINALGTLAVRSARFGDAERFYERALEIRRRFDAHESDAGSSWNNLAWLRLQMGDFTGARAALESVTFIIDPATGLPHVSQLNGLKNLAMACFGTGDLDEAERLLRLVVAIRDRELSPTNELSASALESLGTVLRAKGDLAGARSAIDRALGIFIAGLGPSNRRVADCLDDSAILSLDTSDFAGAKRLIERSLTIRRRALGDDHPDVGRSRILLAAVARASGDPDAALREALAGEAVLREHLRGAARDLSESESLRIEAARASGLDIALSVLNDRAREARAAAVRSVWDQVIRSRALVLDEFAARHRAMLEMESPELISFAEALSRARARCSLLIARGPERVASSVYVEKLRAMQAEVEHAERALEDASPVFRATQTRGRAGLRDVERELPRDAALVAFVRFGRESNVASPYLVPDSPVPAYVAFVESGATRRAEVVPLGPAARIDGLVRRFRDEVTVAPGSPDAAARFRSVGMELRRVLWDPIASRIDKSKVVLVVPDGALSLLSLDALPSERGGFIVEEQPAIQYLSAERDVVDAATPFPAGLGLLVVGGPEFGTFSDSDSQSGGPQRARFVPRPFLPLSSSRSEADELAALWKMGIGGNTTGSREVDELVGAEASESEFRRVVSGHRVIHLATHAYTAHGPDGGDVSGHPTAATPAGVSPLLFSGLAFAGANVDPDLLAGDGENDGILTSEEITSLDLRGVEWAVLSGCETGLGLAARGEGILGLRRAFQIAGARTVVASLWPVEDHAARQWIRRLYEARGSGMSTVEAMRSARLETIRARRRAGVVDHPFYWGAFVAVGDWQ